MRDKFKNLKSEKITTIDVNDFGDYPDIIYDICSDPDENLVEKFDKIICLAVLEHVYDPFAAVKNIRKMLKENGVLYGYVPYLFYYHAPRSLKYQDYFRFSKDALSYLFKDFRVLKFFLSGEDYQHRLTYYLQVDGRSILKKLVLIFYWINLLVILKIQNNAAVLIL